MQTSNWYVIWYILILVKLIKVLVNLVCINNLMLAYFTSLIWSDFWCWKTNKTTQEQNREFAADEQQDKTLCWCCRRRTWFCSRISDCVPWNLWITSSGGSALSCSPFRSKSVVTLTERSCRCFSTFVWRCVCFRCCALQADSEQLKQAWLSALQGSIDLAYRERAAQLTQAGSRSPIPPLFWSVRLFSVIMRV